MIMTHLKPVYLYLIKGGFQPITICKKCNVIGEYWDNHPSDGCYFCGGELYEDKGKWHPPKYKFSFLFINIGLIAKGYWETNPPHTPH